MLQFDKLFQIFTLFLNKKKTVRNDCYILMEWFYLFNVKKTYGYCKKNFSIVANYFYFRKTSNSIFFS